MSYLSRLSPEATLSLLIARNGAQKIDLQKGGPINVGEVELAVGALPQKGIPTGAFAAGPDDQIRIGQPCGVEVAIDGGRRCGTRCTSAGDPRFLQLGSLASDPQISTAGLDLKARRKAFFEDQNRVGIIQAGQCVCSLRRAPSEIEL